MPKDVDGLSASVVDAFGGFRQAAAGVAALSRVIWGLAFRESALAGKSHRSKYLDFSLSELCESLKGYPAFVWGNTTHQVDRILDVLVAHQLASTDYNGSVRALKTACQPTRLGRDVLGGIRPDHEIRYFTMLGIREHYRCAPAAQTAHLFNYLADQLNAMLMDVHGLPNKRGDSRASHNYLSLRNELITSLIHARINPNFSSAAVDMFLELCRAVSFLEAHYTSGQIAITASTINAEHLLSNLFGLTTGIGGFDELFGGGLLLSDEFVAVTGECEWSQGRISGRNVLVTGRYATGKSLLAMQMAVEVARKGGAAWVMPLEQLPEECVYTLETMCTLPTDGSVRVARNTFELNRYLDTPDRGGVLIFLRTLKDSFDTFLDVLPQHIDLMRSFPLRMLVIDPINAIVRKENDSYRAKTMAVFESAKRSGTNIWMNAEENPNTTIQLYEQNIADTVIRLTTEERWDHSQSYVEVTKSRMQRQQRGRHPYAIVPGKGIVISPSSVSFADRISARRLRLGDVCTFGVPGFNKVLGESKINQGDVIVLVGPPGTFKTHVGLLFLHACSKAGTEKSIYGDKEQRIQNILIPARDNTAGIRQRLNESFLVHQRSQFQQHGDIDVCALPSGYVQPGEILHRIEQEFLQARLKRRKVDRVMVDNVPHWEMACPYVRDDQTFADTLLSFFRRSGCTSLLTCSPTGAELQKAIIDNADCVIDFSRIDFRGGFRVIVRVLKTRGMQHRREAFELILGPKGVDLVPDSELLRTSRDGTVTTVKVRLLLHSESEMQSSYNEEVRASIQSTLTPDVILEPQSPLYLTRALSLASSSAVDEMQILQLDEFQLSNLNENNCSSDLYRFSTSEWDQSSWSGFDKRLLSAIRKPGGFCAVPYYENVSVLAYHSDRVRGVIRSESWRDLAEQCAELELRPTEEHVRALARMSTKQHQPSVQEKLVAFDFPAVSSENFNCLFFEILLSLKGRPVDEAQCNLELWLASPEALNAASLLRRICRPAYAKRLRRAGTYPDKSRQTLSMMLPIELDPLAAVWRTWYSTLVRMLMTLDPDDARKIVIVPLPGDVTTAGEWFLAIPSHSAAPDVGLRVIRHLTTPEAEFDRLKRGVGLPTRPSLYENLPGVVSEDFRFSGRDLRRLLLGAFRRSQFGCYRQMSEAISAHLQAVIQVPEEHGEIGISRLLDGLVSRVRMMKLQRICSKCSHTTGPRADC